MKINIFTKRLLAVSLGVLLNTAAIGNEEAEYDLVHKTIIYENAGHQFAQEIGSETAKDALIYLTENNQE